MEKLLKKFKKIKIEIKDDRKPLEEKDSDKEKQDNKDNDLHENNDSVDENDFDDLMNNYDEDNDTKRNRNTTNSDSSGSPSDKLSSIHSSKVYKTLKKLVSLSYERYTKGTYKYNKKDIVKHYITNQKFRIMDDMVSPTFKPDVYVFDLSPSNDDSLELYFNTISSVASKGSIIYLTFNERILRKLTIKKNNSSGIDVEKVAKSNTTRYQNFDCEVFDEFRSLYDELKDIKNKKYMCFQILMLVKRCVPYHKKMIVLFGFQQKIVLIMEECLIFIDLTLLHIKDIMLKHKELMI